MRFLVPFVLLSVCGSAVGQQPAAANPPTVAATVNGQAITVAELDDALSTHLPGGPLTASQRRQLRAALLNDLIDETLLRQFLARYGTKVDPAEIDAQMRSLSAQLVKENRTLADYLKEIGRSEAQLRADWTASIQLAAYVKGQVTDEQLKAYHAAYKDHFDRVEVRMSHVVLRVGRNATPIERAAAREKLQSVRSDLLAGKIDFATAARKFSQCPSALAGGELGFLPRRGLPEDEPLARAAFSLKVGAISDVVETDSGVHLLTVTERKTGSPRAFEKCAVEVLEAYTDDVRLALIAKLRKEAAIRITLP